MANDSGTSPQQEPSSLKESPKKRVIGLKLPLPGKAKTPKFQLKRLKISLDDYRNLALTVIFWPPETELKIGSHTVRADQVDLNPPLPVVQKKLMDIDKYERTEYNEGKLDLG